ncbi:hypothetical protein DSO57_1037346 [Entomophthora muscae]|uniref:Uncharacterized protein n=1 Tax=Entomophthora muscae TaxID=34485 RepID=A0ACC2TA13_9FUNG|nr:hypothetical protein DSO57_1037346 [Entomophthora muscae]
MAFLLKGLGLFLLQDYLLYLFIDDLQSAQIVLLIDSSHEEVDEKHFSLLYFCMDDSELFEDLGASGKRLHLIANPLDP